MKNLPTIDELNAELEQPGKLPTIDELNAGIGQPEKLPTIEELNAGLVQQNRLPTIEELNGEAQPTKKDDPGVFARMKLEKEAQLGKEMGTAEAVASYLPVVGGVVTADANRQRYVEQRLMKGEVSDPTEMIKLAQSIGIDQKQIDELVAQADSGQRSIAGFKMGLNADVLKNGFSVIAKERFANRLKTQQEKQQQLEAAEDLGILGEIAKGTLGAAGAIVEYANPITTWGTLGMEAVNRGAELQNGQWQLDENGNPVQVKAGDGSAASLAKGLAGATAEKAIWTGIAGRIAKIGGGKLLEKIPALNKVAGLAAKGVTGATEKVAAWMAKSDGGRLALKTMETIGKIDEKLHFGSLPNMIFKTRLTELADNVVGLNKPAGERESFGQWLENFVSVENNAELLTGIIGIHLLTAGFGAAKAYKANKEFRHGGGQKGQDYGREELVAEYIGTERAKKLSNQDLENIYELITSPDLTVEKATEFVDKLEADRAKAQEKIDAGESLESVIDGVAEKRAASTRAEEAARLVGEKLQKRAEISPEQHEVLDAKIAEYAGGQEAIAKLVKADIEKNLKDTAAIDNPDMLEELVAMSTRKFNGEARRLKIHDLRGNQDVGAQMQGIEELGVSSWDEAEAQGLVTKDKYGRYGGGARRALNISLHGTDKLKEAVREGRIDGALAEDLLTAAQCELGNRPPEEQAALVDGVLDRANGDAALARRMLEKLTADGTSGGPEPLPKDWKSFSERLDRIAEEAKTEAIRERNPTLSEEEARGAAVEPVETADGKITTVGETVDADGGITGVRQQGAEPKPMTALDGAENADRLAGTKLTVFNGATMSCNRFPEAKVRVSSDGVIVNGLTADALAKPENMADVAAFLTHVSRIAQKNGLKIIFDDAGAANIAKSVLTEIREQGAEKTMNKLNLRSKLFGLLFKTTLGNGVTYDEASFKTALEKTSNGRQFVNSYGDVYGLVDSEGIIHFNPTALHMDTPIHEYGHLALATTKKINNALWKRGNELVKESQYYRDLLAEIKQDPNSPYRNMNEEWLCDEALARLIGDRGAKLVESKGVEAQLKEWLKSVWKAFKGAFGVADLTEEQIEKMSLNEFVDTMNAELLKGGEFGTKKAQPLEKRSIKRFDEDQNSGSNGLLRWKNDRGYLFAIPVDMERTQPGGRVVLATDNANVTDWIQNALNGVELRMSRTGKLYVKGRDGLDGELAEIFGRYPTIGMNDGIFEQIASETGRPAGTTPEALVEALRKDRESYNSWTRDRNAEAEHWKNEQAREEAEAQQRWEQSGMSVVDYVRSRAEEGDPAFDLDWETAREIERDRAAGRFNIGNRDKDGAELNKKPRLKPDLSKRENSVAFKKFVREIPAAPLPERLHDSKPKTVFEWYMNNMVGKTYSFDIPGYGHREFKPNPGHIGKLVCSGGTNSDGTPIVKGRIKNINGKDWQSLVREGKISESDVEGWDPIRARSITLIPEILESFDFVLHEKDRHDRDVLIFAKKFTNKRGRPNTIVMRLIDDGNTIGPVSTHMKDLTETWLKNKDLVTTSGNEVYSRGKDNSASQTPLPAANAESYSTGIDSTIPKSDQNGNGLSKMSVGRLYTGSTADYAKPSLLKVGTGEGSQVYGWGLYASDRRGVAEDYARADRNRKRGRRTTLKSDVLFDGKPARDDADISEKYLGVIAMLEDYRSVDAVIKNYEFFDSHGKLRDGERKNYEWLKANRDRISLREVPDVPQHLYEQTFFTNRAPGDESHLLKWYEPVSEEQKAWIEEQAKKEGFVVDYSIRGEKYIAGPNVGGLAASESGIIPEYWQTGEDAYRAIGRLLGSPKAASEFLARADIDGIKYPVDSYGKTVKDGDKAGWNYVSFRDDNIRVDHKWRDGQALFSAGRGRVDFNPSMIVYNPNLKAMGDLEQNAGGLAAAIEKKEALRPWTKKGSPCDLAKPIAFDSADMVMLWRAVSGSVRNPIIRKGERIPGRKNAVGLNRGGTQIELASKLFGVIDEGDVTKLKADCKADGFFRHENPDWCATQPKVEVDREVDRSQAEIDRRTRELYARRVRTGEGGEHYATQVLGHEIGHTIASLPADANLGPVGNAARTLFDAMARELRRASDPLRQKKGEKDLMAEQTELIKWWHGTDRMPDYYKKPQERFAEVFGIFLTQPESVQSMAPKTYDTLVNLMGKNERLALAYQKINKLKWSGKSNDRVMKQVQATWTEEAQEQYRRLVEESKKAVSLKRDWFNWALNDRFGPMFAIAKRSLAAERKHLNEAVREGAMSKQEAADRIKAKEDEINELKTTLYNWQRQSGGQTRLMIAGFDEVMYNAEKDGVNWNDVREYAHLMRVIELGGRATAHGVDPARAAAILEEKKNKLGVEMFGKIEKTWKAYRAVYEQSVLEDANVRELFDDATNKMLWEMKHFVTMKHRMGVEETAEWLAKIDAYRKGDPNAWDPGIDVYERMHKGLKGGGEGERGFVLYHLVGSFEATEDPLAATIKRAIEIKESAARNHLLKQMSETLRMIGAKGVYDTAIENGARRRTPDPAVYGKLTYMDGGVTHELIVPKVIYLGFKADPMSFGKFGAAMRFLRNTMTIWSPSFVNRAYLIDKSSLETNVKGLHKPAIDVLSEALCFRGVGVPLYMVNNYLTRFTPIANTWVGKILWNEHTVNHYAYRAQKIARMVYEGKFGEHLDRAKELRKQGLTAEASEIEQNVAIAKEMLRKNVFQSTYEFNRNQAGLATEDILRGYGYRIDGSKDAKTWHGKVWEKTKAGGRLWNRFEEEQEACTKIIAYLYQMKMDEKAGRTGAAAADARARLVIEQGGTPNLSARGVFASFIENATGFFWNVRKEGFLRTKRALLDHPTEWITKNLAQTALPALVKGLIATGGMEWLVYKLFGDDEEKIKRSWWAPAFLEHCRFVNEAMKCVPGYYQRNYNVIPLAKFGDEVVSLRVKYSPEEFALQNAIHTAFQKLGKDPTDPSADWSTLAGAMWSEFLPNVAGRNYAQEFLGMLVGPFIGYNPYDAYRQRNVYDKMTWDARWDAPGHMVKEIAKNFWNYSPLGTFTTTFKNGEERKIEDSDVPAWLDRVLQTPFVRMIPASMLAVTSRDSYTKALKEVDDRQAAVVRLAARDILAECVERGSLGGFAEGLKDVQQEYRMMAVRYVINGWRMAMMDPRARQFKQMRSIKDPRLRKWAKEWIEKGVQYQD